MKKFTNKCIVLLTLIVVFSAFFNNSVLAASKKIQIKGVTRTKNSSYEQVFIKLKNYNAKATVSKLKNPARVVITLNNISTSKLAAKSFKNRIKSINKNATSVKSVKFNKNGKKKNSIKVTFKTKSDYTYKVLKQKAGVKVRFYKKKEVVQPPINNIPLNSVELSSKDVLYSNSSGIGSIILNGVQLNSTAGTCEVGISEDKTSISITGSDIEKFAVETPKEEVKDVVNLDGENTGDGTSDDVNIGTDINTRVVEINDGIISKVTYEFASQKLSKITIQCATAMYAHFKYDSVSKQSIIEIYNTTALESKKVFLDAGHGGSDDGSVGSHKYDGKTVTLKEKVINLDITLRINEVLKAKGIPTVLTRIDDTYVSLADRVAMANSSNAALFLSIHNNSFESASVAGTETYCYKKTSTVAYAFTQKIHSAVITSLNRSKLDRGVKEANFYVIKNTTMPACLAEIAFLSNASDMQMLLDETSKQKVSVAIAEAIVSQLFD